MPLSQAQKDKLEADKAAIATAEATLAADVDALVVDTVTTPPPPPATIPTSVDFVNIGSDPRGGDTGYGYLPSTDAGDAIMFRDFSHQESGINSVAKFTPATGVSSIIVQNSPWPGTEDVTNLPFLGNSDNGPQVIVKNQLWAFTGQRATTITGNYNGVLPLDTMQWAINDVAGAFPLIQGGEPYGHQDGAVGKIGSLIYMLGGWQGGNPCDTLDLIDTSGTAPYPYVRHNAYPGAVLYRYCSHNTWVRNGKIRAYGPNYNPDGGALSGHNELREIDISTNPPTSTLVSTNNLPNPVQGEALICYAITGTDFAVVTNGVGVNLLDQTSGTWYDIPINTAADADRNSPTDQGSGLCGFYSDPTNQYVMLGAHAHLYGIRMNYGAIVTAPPPPPPPPPPTTAVNAVLGVNSAGALIGTAADGVVAVYLTFDGAEVTPAPATVMVTANQWSYPLPAYLPPGHGHVVRARVGGPSGAYFANADHDDGFTF